MIHLMEMVSIVILIYSSSLQLLPPSYLQCCLSQIIRMALTIYKPKFTVKPPFLKLQTRILLPWIITSFFHSQTYSMIPSFPVPMLQVPLSTIPSSNQQCCNPSLISKPRTSSPSDRRRWSFHRSVSTKIHPGTSPLTAIRIALFSSAFPFFQSPLSEL